MRLTFLKRSGLLFYRVPFNLVLNGLFSWLDPTPFWQEYHCSGPTLRDSFRKRLLQMCPASEPCHLGIYLCITSSFAFIVPLPENALRVTVLLVFSNSYRLTAAPTGDFCLNRLLFPTPWVCFIPNWITNKLHYFLLIIPFFLFFSHLLLFPLLSRVTVVLGVEN